MFLALDLNQFSSTVPFITKENISAVLSPSALITRPYFCMRSVELDVLCSIIARFNPGISAPSVKDFAVCITPF